MIILKDQAWLRIGKLVAAQGLQGEIRIHSLSDFPERFTEPGKRWIQNNQQQDPQEFNLLRGRKLPGKELFIVRFKEISNRKEAEILIGAYLLVQERDRPKLASNEFHLLDLVGLEVKLKKDGPVIGTVTNLTTAGNDLLEVQLLVGRKVLIPFVHAIVPIVNINEGWLMITPPPGLLEL